MTNLNNRKSTYKDFLNDDKFIKWQVLQTEELNHFWDDYKIKKPEDEDALAKAVEVFRSVRFNNYILSDIQSEALLRNIRKDTVLRKHKIKRLQYYAASAACLLILITSSLFIYNKKHNINPIIETSIIGEAQDSKDIQFVNASVSRALSEDVEIKLDESGKATILDKDGHSIDDISLLPKAINKIVVPYGKRSSIILADGTKVWLNSGTELEFPSTFEGKTRDISVRGEIYIDVAKNPKKPFYVHTSQFDVQVVGTKFNISAYDDEPVKSVVLVDGIVKVDVPGHKSLEMKPNDMIVLETGNIDKYHVNASEYISWKDGILNLKNASLADILNKIGKYYNIKFTNIGSLDLSETTCTGKFILDQNIDSVMTAISVLVPITYSRDENIIHINNIK